MLEKAETIATGSTGRSAAGVRLQYSSEANIQMSLRALDLIDELSSLAGDVGYRQIGYLLLVPEPDWESHLATVSLQQRLGASVQVLSLDEAQEHTPFEPAGLAGATYGPRDGVVDPHWLTSAWFRLARELGARFHFNSPARTIEPAGDGWLVQTPEELIEAPVIVNATGAWAGEVAALAGLEVPIEPLCCMVFLTESLEGNGRHPMSIDTGSGFWLRSEGERLILGLTPEDEPTGFGGGIDWSWLETVLTVGCQRFPWLEDVGIDFRGSWWGYYEMTPDHNAIIGRHPEAPNWVDAAGFSGHGLMHSPTTGLLVAEIVDLGEARSLSTDAFRHNRFSRPTGQNKPESNIF